MKKSLVGDPILWPGLVYSPLNEAGLIFALGTVADSLGLKFEEFPQDGTAICRRRTESGWEKIKIALAIKSSDFKDWVDDIDLLICWEDDLPDSERQPRIVLSQIALNNIEKKSPSEGESKLLDDIMPPEAAESLYLRGKSRENFEETVRQLDRQIKKMKSGE